MTTERALSFDSVAEEYDRVRPEYPDELVERACARAGLRAGSRVLEVGCGTGKLTVALAARGFDLDAVDPGENLIRVARARVGQSVRFHHGRFEEVDLPGGYEALFSATAFHWVDPDVGWAKAARLLQSGGVIALLTHTGNAVELGDSLMAAWIEVQPDAAGWVQRGADEAWAGAQGLRGNIAELWAWFERRDAIRPEAAELFRDVELDRVEYEVEETADELIGLIRTTSAYLTLDRPRQEQLEARFAALVESAGGTCRTLLNAVLVTARAAE